MIKNPTLTIEVEGKTTVTSTPLFGWYPAHKKGRVHMFEGIQNSTCGQVKRNSEGLEFSAISYPFNRQICGRCNWYATFNFMRDAALDSKKG